MNAQEVNQTFDLVSYVSAIVPLKKIGKYWESVKGCPICGTGDDRLQIKRHPDGRYVWICRKCGNGKYQSALNFIMQFHNVPFTEALVLAGGELQPSPRPLAPKPAPVIELPAQEWQQEARQEVDAANDVLLGIKPNQDHDPVTYAALLATHSDSVLGREARAYLNGRGITRAAWVCFDLGYCLAYQRPAVVIPYTDGQIITGIKYRYIDGGKNRFAMKGGSKPYIFGLQNHYEGKRLVVVEGEFNCISLWQTLPHDITVVSCGSETNGQTPLLKALANHFDDILIWMDEPTKARTMRAAFGRMEAGIIKTPVIDGKKWDANAMLQAGVLAEFINTKLNAAYAKAAESERV